MYLYSMARSARRVISRHVVSCRLRCLPSGGGTRLAPLRKTSFLGASMSRQSDRMATSDAAHDTGRRHWLSAADRRAIRQRCALAARPARRAKHAGNHEGERPGRGAGGAPKDCSNASDTHRQEGPQTPTSDAPRQRRDAPPPFIGDAPPQWPPHADSSSDTPVQATAPSRSAGVPRRSTTNPSGPVVSNGRATPGD